MKVGDLKKGCIYRLSTDPRVGYQMAPTPKEEAMRLALYVLKRNMRETWLAAKNARCANEPLVYLGPTMVYGGSNGNKTTTEKVHYFVRPNGKRLYIYGEHIQHIMPFTQG